jgi:hypothetical protein
MDEAALRETAKTYVQQLITATSNEELKSALEKLLEEVGT